MHKNKRLVAFLLSLTLMCGMFSFHGNGLVFAVEDEPQMTTAADMSVDAAITEPVFAISATSITNTKKEATLEIEETEETEETGADDYEDPQETEDHYVSLNSDTYPVELEGIIDYDEIQAVFSQLNVLRVENGLSVLVLDTGLTAAAMQRAAEIALYFDHDRPDGENCFTVIEQSYSNAGENIAAGQWDAASVMDSWTNSPGHYKNMMSEDFSAIGIGCFYQEDGSRYWVQLFTDSNQTTALAKTGREQKTVMVTAQASVFDLVISPTDMSLMPGQTQTVSLYNNINKIFFVGSTKIKPGYYFSDNPDAATVNAAGEITGAEWKGVSENANVHIGISDASEALYRTLRVDLLPPAAEPVTFTISDNKKTYNGEPQGVTVTAVPDIAYTVKYDGSLEMPTDVGLYSVLVESADEAYVGSQTGTLEIIRADISKASIALDSTYLLLTVGQEIQLVATVSPSPDEPPVIVYKSNDETVAVVDSGGKVQAVGVGTAIISAHDEGQGIAAECRMDVVLADKPISESVESVRLLQSSVNSNALSTNHARLSFQLLLPQNMSLGGLIAPFAEEEGKKGQAVRAVQLEGDPLEELFKLNLIDDRQVELIPTEKLKTGPGPASLKTKLLVEFSDGETKTSTNEVTIRINRTKPRLRVSAIRFNSYFPEKKMPVLVSSSIGNVSTVELINREGTDFDKVKPHLENGALFLELADKNAKPKRLLLSVHVDEFSEAFEMPLSVSATLKKPTAKLGQKSVTMNKTANLRIIGDGIAGLAVHDNDNYQISRQPDPNGFFTLTYKAESDEIVTANAKLRLRVTFDGGPTDNPVFVSLSVKKPGATRLKLDRKQVTLNERLPDDSVSLIATITPVDAPMPDISWDEKLDVEIIDNIFHVSLKKDSEETLTEHTLNLRSLGGGQISQGVAGTYMAGESISLAAQAEDGYVFAGWGSSGGGEFGNPAALTTDFIMPNSETTVTAYFVIKMSGNELSVLRLTNQEALKAGNRPMGTTVKLQKAADIRAKELQKLYKHERPDGRDWFSVFDEVGFINHGGAGENIAAGYTSPSAVLKGWMNSPGHRANILRCTSLLGTGYSFGQNTEWGRYWVQLFAYGPTAIREIAVAPARGKVGASIDSLGAYLILDYAGNAEPAYIPITARMCTGYVKNKSGKQSVTVHYDSMTTEFEVTLGSSSSKPSYALWQGNSKILTVRLLDLAPRIKLAVRGRFNVVDPDSVINISPKFTGYNYQGGAVKVDNGHFEIDSVSAAGVVSLRMKDAAVKPRTRQQLILTYEGHDSAPLFVTPRQQKPKLSQSSKRIDLQRSDRYSEGIVDISVQRPLAALIDRVEINGTDATLYEIREVYNGRYALGFKGNSIGNVGKGKNIKLAVYLAGSDTPVTISVRVVVN